MLPAPPPATSQMRQHVSKRLGASADNESTTATSPREGEPSGGKKRHASKKGKTAAIAVTAAFTMSNPGEGLLDDDDSLDVISQLSGIELLHACERLENHNMTLRQRLAKLELQTMQKEHGDDEELNKTDSRLPRVGTWLTSLRLSYRQMIATTRCFASANTAEERSNAFSHTEKLIKRLFLHHHASLMFSEYILFYCTLNVTSCFPLHS